VPLEFNQGVTMSQVLTQAEAVAKWLPQIEAEGVDYAKFSKIEARPAEVGERIVTVTSDGKETENVAVAGDLVLCNIETAAKEEYILAEAKVNKRYAFLGEGSRDGWKLYQAVGECRGIVYDGENSKFIASWGEEMTLNKGDFLVTALPEKGSVYRIGLAEFNSTYRRKV